MKSIPLTKGMVALIDDCDYELITRYSWRAKEHGRTFYAFAKGKKIKQMHRLILPNVESVDHIDGNGLNNCRNNLRAAIHQQNCFNRKKNLKGTSRYKGTHWHKKMGKWASGIRVNQKAIWLGAFDDEQDAALAYDTAAMKYFGAFANLNFPEKAGTSYKLK